LAFQYVLHGFLVIFQIFAARERLAEAYEVIPAVEKLHVAV
jgi:hypothetical protein